MLKRLNNTISIQNSGRITFFRRNFSDTRIPLPFPGTRTEGEEKDPSADSNHREILAPSNSSSVAGAQFGGFVSKSGYPVPSTIPAEEGDDTGVIIEEEVGELKGPGVADLGKRGETNVIKMMFNDFDQDKDGKLNENEMDAFARDVCNFPSSWNFENWWQYILYEYAGGVPGDDGVEDTLDYQGFKMFIEDRPNRNEICRYYLAKRSQPSIVTSAANTAEASNPKRITTKSSSHTASSPQEPTQNQKSLHTTEDASDAPTNSHIRSHGNEGCNASSGSSNARDTKDTEGLNKARFRKAAVSDMRVGDGEEYDYEGEHLSSSPMTPISEDMKALARAAAAAAAAPLFNQDDDCNDTQEARNAMSRLRDEEFKAKELEKKRLEQEEQEKKKEQRRRSIADREEAAKKVTINMIDSALDMLDEDNDEEEALADTKEESGQDKVVAEEIPVEGEGCPPDMADVMNTPTKNLSELGVNVNGDEEIDVTSDQYRAAASLISIDNGGLAEDITEKEGSDGLEEGLRERTG
mmetsp:Transcript_9145/g.12761  ORF Transcript_9145/g.12761 Transcript_9145/m.12761 type:complete len:524 (-) Transcript_9145:319-1890(-)